MNRGGHSGGGPPWKRQGEGGWQSLGQSSQGAHRSSPTGSKAKRSKIVVSLEGTPDLRT